MRQRCARRKKEKPWTVFGSDQIWYSASLPSKIPLSLKKSASILNWCKIKKVLKRGFEKRPWKRDHALCQPASLFDPPSAECFDPHIRFLEELRSSMDTFCRLPGIKKNAKNMHFYRIRLASLSRNAKSPKKPRSFQKQTASKRVFFPISVVFVNDDRPLLWFGYLSAWLRRFTLTFDTLAASSSLIHLFFSLRRYIQQWRKDSFAGMIFFARSLSWFSNPAHAGISVKDTGKRSPKNEPLLRRNLKNPF